MRPVPPVPASRSGRCSGPSAPPMMLMRLMEGHLFEAEAAINNPVGPMKGDEHVELRGSAQQERIVCDEGAELPGPHPKKMMIGCTAPITPRRTQARGSPPWAGP